MRYKLLILLFLTSTLSASTLVQNNHLDAYFLSIKTLDFDKANKHLLKIDSKLGQELELLTKLLYYGFAGKDQNLTPNKVASNNQLIKTIQLLNNGYYTLFYTSNKQDAYAYFHEAINLSQQINYDPLERQALLAMLEYFKNEVARNNFNYSVFLTQYQKLAIDIYDKAYFLIYDLIFTSAMLEVDENYFNKSLSLEKVEQELPQNSNLLPKIYQERAVMLELNNNYEEAQKYYTLTLNTSTDIPYYKELRRKSAIKLAYLEHLKGNNNLALQKIDESFKYYNTDTIKYKFYDHYYRSLFYSGLNDYKNAFNHYKQSVEAGYRLDFRKNSLEIARLQVDLETQKKENQLVATESELKRNRLLLVSSIALLALVGIIMGLVYNNTSKRRKLAESEKLLEQQKVSTLLKEQELVSIDAMIEGQEKERQRIANELHDDLGGLMATVKMHFNALREKQTPELFSKTDELLDDAYDRVRKVAHAKNSGVIAKQGLLTAVQEMAYKISKVDQIKIEVFDFGLEERLENSLELTIFRIIQELITNIIKHADADHATIHLTNHNDFLNIMVEDDGKGFYVANATKNESGMGIKSIDKRVEHLEGTLRIESEPNKGTTVIIDIPL